MVAATPRYDYRARTYDYGIGRFGQEDPVFDPQSFAYADSVGKPSIREAAYGSANPFEYAFNNPLKYIDPMGTDGIPADQTQKIQSKKTAEKFNWNEFERCIGPNVGVALVLTVACYAAAVAPIPLPAKIAGMVAACGMSADLLTTCYEAGRRKPQNQCPVRSKGNGKTPK